jgi:hypothetical protein
MGFFNRFKGRPKQTAKRDGRGEMREIVILLARCSGIFSTCADTISRRGKAFNPNYEAIRMALRLVADCVHPLAERLIFFAQGLDRGALDISKLHDTEIQLCIALGAELRHVAESLDFDLGTERGYHALRMSAAGTPELWQLAQNLRQLEAVANLAGKLHLSRLDETGAASELVLEQLREFVPQKLIEDWASLGPDLRKK